MQKDSTRGDKHLGCLNNSLSIRSGSTGMVEMVETFLVLDP